MGTSEIYRVIGILVRSKRKQRGLTQLELAQRLGLKRTSIGNIEYGRQRIPVDVLIDIATALRVAPTVLMPQVKPIHRKPITPELDKFAAPPTTAEDREWLERALTADLNDCDDSL